MSLRRAAIRHQPQRLLSVETSLRGRGPRRVEGPLERAAALPERHPARSGRQDHPSAPALPLRSVEDLDVCAALPRRVDLPVRGMAHPQTAGHEPTACLAALQTPQAAVEALREAAPRPPCADRCEVHRTDHHRGGRRKRFYQYTAIDDCTRLRVLRVDPARTRRPRSSSWTTSCPGCRSRSRRSRPTMVRSSSRPFTGT